MVVRLGTGPKSHNKVQKSVDDLWMWSGELFEDHPVLKFLKKSCPVCLVQRAMDKEGGRSIKDGNPHVPSPELWMQTGGVMVLQRTAWLHSR